MGLMLRGDAINAAAMLSAYASGTVMLHNYLPAFDGIRYLISRA